MIEEITPTKPTTYGSAHAGEVPNSLRIAAPSSPECWAMPMASRIGSTVTSGGKPDEFSPEVGGQPGQALHR